MTVSPREMTPLPFLLSFPSSLGRGRGCALFTPRDCVAGSSPSPGASSMHEKHLQKQVPSFRRELATLLHPFTKLCHQRLWEAVVPG